MKWIYIFLTCCFLVCCAPPDSTQSSAVDGGSPGTPSPETQVPLSAWLDTGTATSSKAYIDYDGSSSVTIKSNIKADYYDGVNLLSQNVSSLEFHTTTPGRHDIRVLFGKESVGLTIVTKIRILAKPKNFLIPNQKVLAQENIDYFNSNSLVAGHSNRIKYLAINTICSFSRDLPRNGLLLDYLRKQFGVDAVPFFLHMYWNNELGVQGSDVQVNVVDIINRNYIIFNKLKNSISNSIGQNLLSGSIQFTQEDCSNLSDKGTIGGFELYWETNSEDLVFSVCNMYAFNINSEYISRPTIGLYKLINEDVFSGNAVYYNMKSLASIKLVDLLPTADRTDFPPFSWSESFDASGVGGWSGSGGTDHSTTDSWSVQNGALVQSSRRTSGQNLDGYTSRARNIPIQVPPPPVGKRIVIQADAYVVDSTGIATVSVGANIGTITGSQSIWAQNYTNYPNLGSRKVVGLFWDGAKYSSYDEPNPFTLATPLTQNEISSYLPGNTLTYSIAIDPSNRSIYSYISSNNGTRVLVATPQTIDSIDVISGTYIEVTPILGCLDTAVRFSGMRIFYE